MKRFALGLVAVLIVALAIAYALRTQITTRVMENSLARNLGADFIGELPDGLHVALCGAGSPLPDPNRSGPCVAVIAGRRLFVVDSGAGSSRVMSRMRLPQGAIEAILLTHFHSDHIDGLGELEMQRWANGGHAAPVPIYGPTGVGVVVDGFNLAYRHDRGYRVTHHGEEIMIPSGHGAEAREFPTPTEGEGSIVIDDGDVKIIAFLVNHDPIEPAVGYRFDYKGRSALISGDTVKSPNLQKFAEGVGLLVHEALDPELLSLVTEATANAGRDRLVKITTDIVDYHTTPEQAAEIARDAGVGHLLYHHIVPPLLLPPMVDIFLDGVADVYGGPVTVGTDGTMISLPAGGRDILVSERL